MTRDLGTVYRRWGKPKRALSLLNSALAAQQKKLGSTHVDLADALVPIGRTYLDLQQPDKAIQPLRRAVELRSGGKIGPTKLGEAQFVLAQALLATGKRAQAIKLAGRARANYRKRPGCGRRLAG